MATAHVLRLPQLAPFPASTTATGEATDAAVDYTEEAAALPCPAQVPGAIPIMVWVLGSI